jgi:hypothetical protein
LAPTGYSGPWGKLISERKKKLKISCQTPFIEKESSFGLSASPCWLTRKGENLRSPSFYQTLQKPPGTAAGSIEYIKLVHNVAVGFFKQLS